jgi:hypothetical protein
LVVGDFLPAAIYQGDAIDHVMDHPIILTRYISNA